MDNEILIEGNICKSISGQEDENGNYIFEVEASNENLDLQNQRTLQSALMKSKEYFLTNGVISDDHQHKVRNPDGTVESHKEKIIGEPISVRTDGKSTFVKGILYKGVAAAKDYINLLKNHSSRVKASIGGIMPTIRKEKDGSETVTGFMWNDLALTTSPVNWTVGSARFAKSVSMVDFCKSLEAGSGVDAADFEGGRALQKEDLEEETTKLLDINDGEMDPADSIEKDEKNKKFFDKEELEKSIEEMEINDIKDCIQEINKGNLTNASEITAYLIGKGFDKRQARETMLEIIEQGGRKMAKGNFSETVDEILKSIGVKKSADAKKKPEDEEIEKETLFEFDDDSEGDEEKDIEDDVEKCGAKGSVKKGCGVEKSLEEDDDYLDATELVKSMGAEIDALREENEELKKSVDEIKGSVIDIAKALGEPVARQSVVAKSIPGNGMAAPTSNARPSNADFDMFKVAICKSAQGGKIEPEKVQFYNSEFQKAMNGGIKAVKPEVWQKICSIVRENQ